MVFSGAVICGILADKYGTDEGDASREERQFAAAIIRLIDDAITDHLLDFEEEDEEFIDFDDLDDNWDADDKEIPKGLCSESNVVMFGDTAVPVEKVKEAITFYRSTTTGSRPLSAMTSRFRFIKCQNHISKLRSFETTGNVVADRLCSLRQLSDLLESEIFSLFERGITMHDVDVREVALRINRDKKLVDGFKASPSWINAWKRSVGISSRRVTKFVSKKNFRDQAVIEQAAKDFVEKVRMEINTAQIQLSSVCNSDQSGFQKELHTARTLAPVGEKKVLRVVQSSTALTHSYTLLPRLFMDGTLGDKLFVVLAEPKGQFPRAGHFVAPNLEVRAGTSHIMNKGHMIDWFRTCVFGSTAPTDTYLIVDSWSSFRDVSTIGSLTPAGCTLELRHIPPGATSMVQPLDVHFFGPFKGIVKRITCHVIAKGIPFPMYQRDNILKVVSLVYGQLRAPCFKSFLQYPWYAAGYLDHHPGPFQSPAEVLFDSASPSSLCRSSGCTSVYFISCAHCSTNFCFKCFFVDFHQC